MENHAQTRYVVCAKCSRDDKTFVCNACGGTFEKAWSEDEALAEMRARFGDIPEMKRAIVCADCITAVDTMIVRSTN